MNPKTPNLIFDKFISHLEVEKTLEGRSKYARGYFAAVNFHENESIFTSILTRLEERGFNLDAMAAEDPATLDEQQPHLKIVYNILKEMLPKILSGKNYQPGETHSWLHLEALLEPYKALQVSIFEKTQQQISAQGGSDLKYDVLRDGRLNPSRWFTEGDIDALKVAMGFSTLEIASTFQSSITLSAVLERFMIANKDNQDPYRIPILINNATSIDATGSHWRCAVITVIPGDPGIITANIADSLPLAEATKGDLERVLRESLNIALGELRRNSDPSLAAYANYTVANIEAVSKEQQSNGHSCLDFAIYNLLSMYCSDNQNEFVQAILAQGGDHGRPQESSLRKLLLEKLLTSIRVSASQISQVHADVRPELIEVIPMTDPVSYCLQESYIKLLMSSMGSVDFKVSGMVDVAQVSHVESVVSKTVLRLSRKALQERKESDEAFAKYLIEYAAEFQPVIDTLSTEINIKDYYDGFVFQGKNFSQHIQQIANNAQCREIRFRNLALLQENDWEGFLNVLYQLKNITQLSYDGYTPGEKLNNGLRLIEKVNSTALEDYQLPASKVRDAYVNKLESLEFPVEGDLEIVLSDYFNDEDKTDTFSPKLALLVEKINKLCEGQDKQVVLNCAGVFTYIQEAYYTRVVAILSKLNDRVTFKNSDLPLIQKSQAIIGARHQPLVTDVGDSVTFVNRSVSLNIDFSKIVSDAMEDAIINQRLQALIQYVNQLTPCCRRLELTNIDTKQLDYVKTLIRGLTTVTTVDVASVVLSDEAQSVCDAIALRNKALEFLEVIPENTHAAWAEYLAARLNSAFGKEDSRVLGAKGLTFFLDGSQADRSSSGFNKVDFNQKLRQCAPDFLQGFLAALNILKKIEGSFPIDTLSFDPFDLVPGVFDSVIPAEEQEAYQIKCLEILKTYIENRHNCFPFKSIKLFIPVAAGEVSDRFHKAIKDFLLAFDRSERSMQVILQSHNKSQIYPTTKLEDLKNLYQEESLRIGFKIQKSDSDLLVSVGIPNQLAINARSAQSKKYASLDQSSTVATDTAPQLIKSSKPVKERKPKGSSIFNVSVEANTESEAEVEASGDHSSDIPVFMDSKDTAEVELANPNLDPKSLLYWDDIVTMEDKQQLYSFYLSYQNRPALNHATDAATLQVSKLLMPDIEKLDRAKYADLLNRGQYLAKKLLSPRNSKQFIGTVSALTPAAFDALILNQSLFEGTLPESLPDGFFICEYQSSRGEPLRYLDYDMLRLNSQPTPLTQTLHRQKPYEFTGDLRQFLDETQLKGYLDKYYPATRKEIEKIISSCDSFAGDRTPVFSLNKFKDIMQGHTLTQGLADKIINNPNYAWVFADEAGSSGIFKDKSKPLKNLFTVLHFAGLEGLNEFLATLSNLRKNTELFNGFIKNFIDINADIPFAHLNTPEILKAINALSQLSPNHAKWWNYFLDKHFQFGADKYSAIGHHTEFLELFNGFQYFVKEIEKTGMSLPVPPPQEQPRKGVGYVSCPNMMVFMDRILRVLRNTPANYRLAQLRNLHNLDWTNQGVVYDKRYRFVHESMRLNPEFGYDIGSEQLKQNYKKFMEFVRGLIDSEDSCADPYYVNYANLKNLVSSSGKINKERELRPWNFIPVLFFRYLGMTTDNVNVSQFHKYLALEEGLQPGEQDSAMFVRLKIELHAIAAIATTGRGAELLYSEDCLTAFSDFLRSLEARVSQEGFEDAFHRVNSFIMDLFEDTTIEKPNLNEMTGLLRFLQSATELDDSAAELDDKDNNFNKACVWIKENAGDALWKALDRWNKNPDRLSNNLLFIAFNSLNHHREAMPSLTISLPELLSFMSCIRVSVDVLDPVPAMTRILASLMMHPLSQEIIDYMNQIKLGTMDPQLLSIESLKDIFEFDTLMGLTKASELKAYLKDKLPIATKKLSTEIVVDEAVTVETQQVPASAELFTGKIVAFLKGLTSLDFYKMLSFFPRPGAEEQEDFNLSFLRKLNESSSFSDDEVLFYCFVQGLTGVDITVDETKSAWGGYVEAYKDNREYLDAKRAVFDEIKQVIITAKKDCQPAIAALSPEAVRWLCKMLRLKCDSKKLQNLEYLNGRKEVLKKIPNLLKGIGSPEEQARNVPAILKELDVPFVSMTLEPQGLVALLGKIRAATAENFIVLWEQAIPYLYDSCEITLGVGPFTYTVTIRKLLTAALSDDERASKDAKASNGLPTALRLLFSQISKKNIETAISGKKKKLQRELSREELSKITEEHTTTKESFIEGICDSIVGFVYANYPSLNPETADAADHAIQAYIQEVYDDLPTVHILGLDKDIPRILDYTKNIAPTMAFLLKVKSESPALLEILVKYKAQLKSLDHAVLEKLLEVLKQFKLNDEWVQKVIFENPALKDISAIPTFANAMTIIKKTLDNFEYNPLVYQAVFNGRSLRTVDQMLEFAEAVKTVLSKETLPLATRLRIITVAAAKENIDFELVLSVIHDVCKLQPALEDKLISMILNLAEKPGINRADLSAAFSWMKAYPKAEMLVSHVLEICDYNPDDMIKLIGIAQQKQFDLKDYLAIVYYTKYRDNSGVLKFLSGQQANDLVVLLSALTPDQFTQITSLYKHSPYPQFAKLEEIISKRSDADAFQKAIADFPLDPSGLLADPLKVNELYDQELQNKIPRIMDDLRVIGTNGHQRSLLQSERRGFLEALVYIHDRSKNHYRAYQPQNLKEDFSTLKEQLQGLTVGTTEHNAAIWEILALIREVYRRTSPKGELPRLVQLLPLLLSADGNAFTQIKTGEGKTTVTALQAVMKHVQGGSVDILTSDNSLARDGVDKNAEFFKYLGISCGFLDENSPVESYQENGIYYGDLDGVALFHQQHDFLLDKDIDAKRHVILDEFDYAAFDKSSSSRYARVLSGNRESPYKDLFPFLYDFMQSSGYEPDEDSIAELKEYMEDKQGLNRIPLPTQRQFLALADDTDTLRDLLSSAYDVERMMKTPNEYFLLHTLKTQNADGFQEFILDAQVLIPKPNGRVASANSRFSGYTHAMLHAVIARCFAKQDEFYQTRIKSLVEAANGMKVHPPKVADVRRTLSQMTPNAIFLRYLHQANGSDVFGLTGTLAANQLAKLCQTAGARAYIIPPFEISAMTIQPTIVARVPTVAVVEEQPKSTLWSKLFKSRREAHTPVSAPPPITDEQRTQEHLAEIAKVALQEVQEGKPVLLFAATDEYAQKIESKLKEEGNKLSSKPAIELYIKEQGENLEERKEHEKSVVDRAAKPGAITITTLLSRGTDIEGSPTVIDTSLWGEADDRGLWQRWGRTARNGKQGKVYLILSENEFTSRAKPVPETAEAIEKTIVEIRAEIAFKKGKDWAIKNGIVMVFTQFQDNYIQFMRRLKEVTKANYENMGLDTQFENDWKKKISPASHELWAKYYEKMENRWATAFAGLSDEIDSFTATETQRLQAVYPDDKAKRTEVLHRAVEDKVQFELSKALDKFVKECKGQFWADLCQDILKAANDKAYLRAYTNYQDKKQEALAPRFQLVREIKALDQQIADLRQKIAELSEDKRPDTASISRQSSVEADQLARLEGEEAALKEQLGQLEGKIERARQLFDAKNTALNLVVQAEQPKQGQQAKAEAQGVATKIWNSLKTMVTPDSPAVRAGKEAVRVAEGELTRAQQEYRSVEGSIQQVVRKKQAAFILVQEQEKSRQAERAQALEQAAALAQEKRLALESQVTKLTEEKQALLERLLVSHMEAEVDYVVAEKLTLEQVNVGEGLERVDSKPANIARSHQALVTNFSMKATIPTPAQVRVSLGRADPATQQEALVDYLVSFVKLNQVYLIGYDKQDFIKKAVTSCLDKLLKDKLGTRNPSSLAAIKRQYWALLEGIKLYGDDQAKTAVYDAHVSFIRDTLPAEKQRVLNQDVDSLESDLDPFATHFEERSQSEIQEIAQYYDNLQQRYVRRLYELGEQGFLPAGYDLSPAKLLHTEHGEQALWDDVLAYLRDEIKDYKSVWWKSRDRKGLVRELQDFIRSSLAGDTHAKISALLAKLEKLSLRATEQDYAIDQTRRWRSFRNNKEGGSRFQKMLARIRDKALASLSTDEAVYRAQVGSIKALSGELAKYGDTETRLHGFDSEKMSDILDLLKDQKAELAIDDRADLENYKTLVLFRDQLQAMLPQINPESLAKNERGFYHALLDLQDRISSLKAVVSVSGLRGQLTSDPEMMIREAVQAVAGNQPLNTDPDFCHYVADRYQDVSLVGEVPADHNPRIYQMLYALEQAHLQARPDAQFKCNAVIWLPGEGLIINYNYLLPDDSDHLTMLTVKNFAQPLVFCERPEAGSFESLGLTKEGNNRPKTAAMLKSLAVKSKVPVMDPELQKLLMAIIVEYKFLGHSSGQDKSYLDRVKDCINQDQAAGTDHFEEILKKLKEKYTEKFGSLIDANPTIQKLREEAEVFFDSTAEVEEQPSGPSTAAMLTALGGAQPASQDLQTLLQAIVDAYANLSTLRTPADPSATLLEQVQSLATEHKDQLANVYHTLKAGGNINNIKKTILRNEVLRGLFVNREVNIPDFVEELASVHIQNAPAMVHRTARSNSFSGLRTSGEKPDAKASSQDDMASKPVDNSPLGPRKL